MQTHFRGVYIVNNLILILFIDDNLLAPLLLLVYRWNNWFPKTCFRQTAKKVSRHRSPKGPATTAVVKEDREHLKQGKGVRFRSMGVIRG